MAKKQHHEEHENHERWLVSYADFITLLFAFFVVLYSISRVDNKRMAQVQQSIKFALHFKGTGGIDQLPLFEGPPVDGGKCKRERGEKKLKTYLQMRPQPSVVQIETERDRITVRLSASHFFDPSQAAIRPEMIPILDLIAEELVLLDMPLRIEGHTDESRLGSGRFRDNWELSSSRAAAVASYIESAHHMDGKLLSAAGYGSTRPLVQGRTAAAHEANRRVEMVVQFEPGGE